MKKTYTLFLILVSFFYVHRSLGMKRFLSQLFNGKFGITYVDWASFKRLRELHKLEDEIHSLEDRLNRKEFIAPQRFEGFYVQAIEWYARELQNTSIFCRESIIEKGNQMIEVRNSLRQYAGKFPGP